MSKIAKVTIANGATSSDAAILHGDIKIIGIPASMTGTTLKVHASSDNTTWSVCKGTDGNDLSITIGSAAAWIPVGALNLQGLRNVKLVSGSAETGAKVLSIITD